MDDRERPMTFGFPRMHKEAAERRDFLPPLVGLVADLGCEVFVEWGLGFGMGYEDIDYASLSPRVHVTDEPGWYRQDVVVILRAPVGRFEWMRPGVTLLSMLHFPTRPARVRHLQ
jgi:alanine dehydrogenase